MSPEGATPPQVSCAYSGGVSKKAPNRSAKHVYAVLRFDPPSAGESLNSLVAYPGNFITLKELLPTEEEAEREVERLSALNAHTRSVYFTQIGRLYPDGRNLSAD